MKAWYLGIVLLSLLFGCTQQPVDDNFNQRCIEQSEFELEKLASSFDLLENVFEDTEINLNLPSCASDSTIRIIEGNPVLCGSNCLYHTSECNLIEHRKENFSSYTCIEISEDIELLPGECVAIHGEFTSILEKGDSLRRGTYYFNTIKNNLGKTLSICGYEKS